MKIAEVFRNITGTLEQVRIGYMLTGSFASAYHGSPRTTQDIDMVIEANAEQLRAFVNLLLKIDYYVDLDAAIEALRRQSMFNVVDRSSGWKVDLIIRKSRPFSEEEFRRRKLVQLESNLLYIASAEDVVISKLEWAKQSQSQRQIEDAAGILRMQWPELDKGYLQQWAADLNVVDEWQAALKMAGIPEAPRS